MLFPTPQFPAPIGPLGIGTRVYSWIDSSRAEPFTPNAGDHRAITVQIWFPTAAEGKVQRYIEQPAVLAAVAARLHIPPFLLGRLQSAPTHAIRNAPPKAGRYPVLINPTGFSGFHAANLFWIEALVSHGYVVVTVDQPGTAAAATLEDGRVLASADKTMFDRYMPLALSSSRDQTPVMNGVSLPGGIIPFLAADMSFVLDRLAVPDAIDDELAAILDLDRVGIFGMSLGGYIGPEACRTDRRFKACVAVDAGKTATTADTGLAQPLMIISRDADVMREERSKAGGWAEEEIEHTISSQRRLYENNAGDAYFVTMNGMYHVNWTDAPIWTPLVGWLGLAGPIDPYDGFSVTNTCTLSFFDRYLRGALSANICPERDPNVTRLEVRQARHP
ncbi:hypothetical protein [Paracoccus sp. (in: a-proteobacteria)]|uniref:alpha/beta hydrolase family protein n=1 Tax=Paracoccus sp. TaxID=267 RepID=UPI0028A76B1B|nr:hypothetical protein [Paracoccus sp. (in: a-proteobacteria)]